MDTLAQLEKHSSELAKAVESLASYSRGVDAVPNGLPPPLLDPEGHKEIQRARDSILSNVARIKTLVCRPTDFLKHLASQSEILACLRWMGEFQILACIPLVGSVPIKDIAELSGVPENSLARVIRLTATVAFLHEPQPGLVAHTPLSAPFVSNPSYLDAAMFLSELAVPAALQMAPATQRFCAGGLQPLQGIWSACDLAPSSIQPFHTAREERPKLLRQWAAFLHHAAGLQAADGEEVVDILAQLQWANINSSSASACIVEVGAQSTAAATAQSLARLYPTLRFQVQISDTVAIAEQLGASITVAQRTVGSRQTVRDGAVYLLHLPPAASAVLAELHAHLDVLRTGNAIMLILTPRLLPEPCSTPNPEIEAVARARDLALLQLANESEMEMGELLELIDTVRDSEGRLVVTGKLRSKDNLVVALVVRYRGA